MEGGYTEGDEFIGFGKTALEKAKGIEFIEGDWEPGVRASSTRK